MECQIERGCGLDVHRDTVAACVRVPGRGRSREQHVRTFGTTAAELLQLRARRKHQVPTGSHSQVLCGRGSWGGRRLSLADYVRRPGATRAATAAAAC